MIKNTLIISTILVSSFTFSQEKKEEKKGTITSRSLSLIDKANINSSNITDLQEYIENLYIEASKFYNKGALPTIKKGEYHVLLIDSKGKGITKKSSDFQDLNPNSVEELTYNKSPKEEALYGSFGEKFGIIIIKLKDK